MTSQYAGAGIAIPDPSVWRDWISKRGTPEQQAKAFPEPTYRVSPDGSVWAIYPDGRTVMVQGPTAPPDPTGFEDLAPSELQDLYAGMGQGGVGAAPIPPASEYFGTGEGAAPYAGYLRKLQAGGLLGETPAGQWMQRQYDPMRQRWAGQSLLDLLQGQQMTPWYEATPQWTADPNLFGQLRQTAAGGLDPEMQNLLTANPRAVYGAATGATGARGQFQDYLAGRESDLYQRWKAFGDPMAPETTGQSWMDWLAGRMGLGQ